MDDMAIRARLIDDVSRPAKKVESAIDGVRKAAEKSSKTGILPKDTEHQVGGALKSMGRLNSMMSKVHGTANNLGRKGFGVVASGARAMGRAVMSAGRMAVAGLSMATWAVKGVAVSLAGAATAFAAFGVKSYGSIEQIGVAFGTLLGSKSAATQFMAEMERFATVTPFRFQEVADSAKLLPRGRLEAERDHSDVTQGWGRCVCGVGTDRSCVATAHTDADRWCDQLGGHEGFIEYGFAGS